jgi:hypothetical protein
LTAGNGGGIGGVAEHAPTISPEKISAAKIGPSFGPDFVSNVLSPKLIPGPTASSPGLQRRRMILRFY